MVRVFIGIGSNVGDRHAHLELAQRELAVLPQSTWTAMSRVYETDPVGPVVQGKYLNAAAELHTQLSPQKFLGHLAKIERQADRLPADRRVKWGPRTLDLDIILYGNRVISQDDLIIPHPMMHERWFVLKPLADLAPDVVHPLLEMTVGQLLEVVEKQHAAH